MAAAGAGRRADRADRAPAEASSSAAATARSGPGRRRRQSPLEVAPRRRALPAGLLERPRSLRLVRRRCTVWTRPTGACWDPQLAPEKRFVNIMDRLMSAWPLGGGVVVGERRHRLHRSRKHRGRRGRRRGRRFASGEIRWRQAFTLDRKEPKLSFGVQGNSC